MRRSVVGDPSLPAPQKDPVPRLNPRRDDRPEEIVRATLNPFVCTWDDLPKVQAPRASASTDALVAIQLVGLGVLLLSLTAPLR